MPDKQEYDITGLDLPPWMWNVKEKLDTHEGPWKRWKRDLHRMFFYIQHLHRKIDELEKES